MKFENVILEMVKEAKECNFVSPFVLLSFLKKIEKKAPKDAEINIYTLPKTCDLLKDKFSNINFYPVDEDESQLHSKFYLVENEEGNFEGIFGSPNLTGTSLEIFFNQSTKYSLENFDLKWSEKNVLGGISKKIKELIPEWDTKTV